MLYKQMYILLATFSISLFGIIIMIAHKLSLARSGKIIELERPHPLLPDLQKIKYSTYKTIKMYEHLALVLIIRSYIKSAKFIKQKYGEIKTKIKSINLKNRNQGMVEEIAKHQVSAFLNMVSDYKYRIRHIKHKIRKEEEN